MRRCPQLNTLTLKDQRDIYTLSEIVHWLPADFLRLQYLSLQGTPALSFNPDTFKSTAELVRLELRMITNRGHAFIPPPEEFDVVDQEEAVDSGADGTPSTPVTRGPVWTWDWELPKLTNLKLAGESAYRFQFNMLKGTPNLVSFSVDINSRSSQHHRTLSVFDMVKPEYQHSLLNDEANLLVLTTAQMLSDTGLIPDDATSHLGYYVLVEPPPYIDKHQLAGRLLVDEPIGRYHSTNDQVIVADALARELHKDMTWTLAVNIAEYVQPLITPLSDVARSGSGATVQVSGRGRVFGG
ncbi:hypothetical protein BGX24_010920 [Mortierella sp. AD032]|nr:hypothetical protein BGX24_010920 [Mortierella sp. AD032]